MRTKEQILDDSQRAQLKDSNWDTVASVHEHLTIEVLIDIRDILENFRETRESFLKHIDDYHTG